MKEALKLELEALKYAASMGHGGIVREMKVTPFTIKEALAQPEQEPCGGCGGSGWVPRDPDIGTDQECFDCNGSGAQPLPVQPEQEPGSICYKHDEPKRGCSWCDKHLPKRPWVRLTDEFCITNMFDMGHYSLQIVFKSRKNADEFKAALKEKNT